jgi:hypothetical protein
MSAFLRILWFVILSLRLSNKTYANVSPRREIPLNPLYQRGTFLLLLAKDASLCPFPVLIKEPRVAPLYERGLGGFIGLDLTTFRPRMNLQTVITIRV